jgi:hypothetical protein
VRTAGRRSGGASRCRRSGINAWTAHEPDARERPSLAEGAREDADLEPLRDDPRFAEIVADQATTS